MARFIHRVRIRGGPAFILLLAASAARALEPSTPVDAYGVDRWGQREGLPQNSALSLAQSDDGYLWVGTEEGLVRFDGLDFHHVALPGGAAHAAQRTVDVVMALPGNRMVLASRTGRVLTGGPAGFLPAGDMGHGNAQPGVCRASTDGASAFIQCADDPLVRVSSQGVETWIPPPAARGERPRVVLRASDDALWVATDKALWRVHGKDAARVDLGAAGCTGTVEAMRQHTDGTLWVGTWTGHVCRAWPGPPTEERGANMLDGARVRDILHDRHGLTWVASARGLARLDAAGTWSRVRAIHEEDVYALHEDAEGSLWVGTGLALVRLRDTPFRTFGSPEGMTSESTHAVCAARGGGAWIATRGGEVFRVRGDALELVHARTSGDGRPMRGCHEDADGALWLVTGSEFIVSRRGLLSEVPAPDNVSVSTVLQDGRRCWAMADGGLQCMGQNGLQPVDVAGKPRGRVQGLYTTTRGEEWMVTLHGAARRVDGRWNVMFEEDTQGSITWLEDDRGSVWITSQSGMRRWRDGTLSAPVTEDHGLPDTVPHAMLQDDSGRVWMSTNARGLFQWPGPNSTRRWRDAPPA